MSQVVESALRNLAKNALLPSPGQVGRGEAEPGVPIRRNLRGLRKPGGSEYLCIMQKRIIALAFSGGLDTSYCVPRLAERGFVVHTGHVNTGGAGPAEPAALRRRGWPPRPRPGRCPPRPPGDSGPRPGGEPAPMTPGPAPPPS